MTSFPSDLHQLYIVAIMTNNSLIFHVSAWKYFTAGRWGMSQHIPPDLHRTRRPENRCVKAPLRKVELRISARRHVLDERMAPAPVVGSHGKTGMSKPKAEALTLVTPWKL